MPIYEYTCSECGKTQDVLQKVDAPAPEACTLCAAKGTLTKLLSRTSFVLKGGGWYSDLYGSVKKDKGTADSGSGSTGGGSSEPAKAAPAPAKAEAKSSSG